MMSSVSLSSFSNDAMVISSCVFEVIYKLLRGYFQMVYGPKKSPMSPTSYTIAIGLYRYRFNKRHSSNISITARTEALAVANNPIQQGMR